MWTITTMRNKFFRIPEATTSTKMLKTWVTPTRLWQLEKERRREEFSFSMPKSFNLPFDYLNSSH